MLLNCVEMGIILARVGKKAESMQELQCGSRRKQGQNM